MGNALGPPRSVPLTKAPIHTRNCIKITMKEITTSFFQTRHTDNGRGEHPYNISGLALYK